jgi:hypothetical protein
VRTALGLGLMTLVALLGCAGEEAPEPPAAAADEIVDVPPSRLRDQRETGNCWLYATAAWAESLERGALNEKQGSSRARAPAPLSIAYFDYWDWFSKITGGEVKGTDAKVMREDQLDSGGSWGYAVEVMARYGLARASAFGGTGVLKDADITNAALDAIIASLLDGPLKTPASRKDGALVRKELDKAFKLSAKVSASLTVSFGADGKRSFTKGTASDSDVVIPPDAFEVLVPRAGGPSVVRSLSDAIGHRAPPGDDPDLRAGEFAWNVVTYVRKNPTATRAYFRRIQRALHAGVPIPISWFLAANGDPDKTGAYREVPAEPADIIDSTPHQTVIADYQVADVPGFGTLKAGTNATAAQREAALDERANIVFFRVTDSYATRIVDSKRVGVNDLYVEYLTGTVRVCPAGVARTSRSCRNEIPLMDVTLPAGF